MMFLTFLYSSHSSVEAIRYPIIVLIQSDSVSRERSERGSHFLLFCKYTVHMIGTTKTQPFINVDKQNTGSYTSRLQIKPSGLVRRLRLATRQPDNWICCVKLSVLRVLIRSFHQLELDSKFSENDGGATTLFEWCNKCCYLNCTSTTLVHYWCTK